MQKEINEILFNKNNRRGVVKTNAQDAKKLINLIQEHDSRKIKVPEVVINLYTHKLQKSTTAIANKLAENKLRPFEFYIIEN